VLNSTKHKFEGVRSQESEFRIGTPDDVPCFTF
jgi:hypothetical protein